MSLKTYFNILSNRVIFVNIFFKRSVFFTETGERRGYDIDNVDEIMRYKIREIESLQEEIQKQEASRHLFFLSIQAFKELNKRHNMLRIYD